MSHQESSMPRPILAGALVAAASLLLLACPGCGSGGSGGSAKADSKGSASSEAAKPTEAISVAVSQVQQAPMAALYATSATLRAEKQATVTSRTRGVLEELLVEEGDPIREGQIIARLEDDEQELALGRFRAIREIKTSEFDRATRLHEQKVFSDSEYEVIRREAEEAKHDVELAALNLARTTIAAPFDGLVVRRHIDVGATVSDGTPIYDLADLDPLYADVNVPERHVKRLSIGQNVRLGTDATRIVAEARIERIAPVVDPASGTVKVTVTIPRSEGLRPGAFVEVDIVTDVHDEAIVVPRSALVAEGRRWNVFRVNPDQETVEMLEVQLAFEEGDRVEIADVLTKSTADLRPGDTVVSTGASALSDGARIRILDAGSVEEGTVDVARTGPE